MFNFTLFCSSIHAEQYIHASTQQKYTHVVAILVPLPHTSTFGASSKLQFENLEECPFVAGKEYTFTLKEKEN